MLPLILSAKVLGKIILRDGDRGHWLPFLEWMVTTSCDLACPGCDRFIDYNHNWTENLDNIAQNMEAWSKHLDPDNLTLIGGEPLLHPYIYDIINLTRKNFDHACIEIYTNGLLFPKRPKLIEQLLELGNAKISLTYHNRDPQVRSIIDKNIKKYIFKQYAWYQTGPNTWQYKDVVFETTDPTQGDWYDYRRNINGVLKPWNDKDPASSYANCSANIYPIIYKNRLYKCPPISMLETHLTKYNQLNDADWAPYLEYKGLGLDCTEDELDNFINNIQQPHSICAMCPANPNRKPQPEALIKHKMEKL